MKKVFLLLLIFFGLTYSANAEDSDISNSLLNITIVPFEADGISGSVDINEIITNNLNRSGHFNVSISEALTDNQIDFNFWKQHKKDAIVFGKIEQISSNVYNLYIYIYDVSSQKSLYQKKVRVHNSGFRRIAHFLSDKIHEVFLGKSGAFDTKLAYVSVTKDYKDELTYRLQISDSDGFNQQTVVRSSKPILSPSWSPDQNQLAYISLKNGQAEAFIIKPYEKSSLIMLPKLDGLVSNPSWHPNGENILLTLSKSYDQEINNKDIYSYNINSKKLTRLTTHPSSDTEAKYSPDGKSIVFSSYRNNTKAIYIKNLDTKAIYEVPIDSPHVSEPVFSPDGDKLAFIYEFEYQKRVAIYDFKTKKIDVLTYNKLDNSPSFSPNGEMIIFATNSQNKGILSIINLRNNQIVELQIADGNVIQPTWLNYKKDNKSLFNSDELFASFTNNTDLNFLDSANDNNFQTNPPVKLSRSGICHPEDSFYYSITKNFTPYDELQNCIDDGGRLPLNYVSKKNNNENDKVSAELKPSEDVIELELEFWNSIKDSNDPDEYQIYLDEHPEGKFVKLAKLRIKKLSIPAPKNTPKLDYGNYHALIIGNDKYKHLSPLSNAVNDANDVAALLRSKYKFNVNLLTNATRNEIVSALSKLRNSISSSDNLLVYYAGHGYLDKEADEGFWLPVDAEMDNDVHWVANERIMSSVRAMQAKHIMVVADSCFSGTLTRGIKIKDNSPNYIKKIVQKKARTVLTSGGLEPVSDVGGGNNSVFASSFLNALRDNDGVLDGNQLFSIIRKQVMLNSDQTPQYGDIRKAGHDGGDFIFVSE